jgi:hypothetical protein
MAATSRRLLILAVALALLAGVAGTNGHLTTCAVLAIAAGACGLLSWAAFVLWYRDWAKPQPSKRLPLPLTSVRAGKVGR